MNENGIIEFFINSKEFEKSKSINKDSHSLRNTELGYARISLRDYKWGYPGGEFLGFSTGHFNNYYEECRDLRTLNFDDKISSFRFGQTTSTPTCNYIAFFEGLDFTGKSLCLYVGNKTDFLDDLTNYNRSGSLWWKKNWEDCATSFKMYR